MALTVFLSRNDEFSLFNFFFNFGDLVFKFTSDGFNEYVGSLYVLLFDFTEFWIFNLKNLKVIWNQFCGTVKRLPFEGSFLNEIVRMIFDDFVLFFCWKILQELWYTWYMFAFGTH